MILALIVLVYTVLVRKAPHVKKLSLEYSNTRSTFFRPTQLRFAKKHIKNIFGEDDGIVRFLLASSTENAGGFTLSDRTKRTDGEKQH
jgi:hypothetical protein